MGSHKEGPRGNAGQEGTLKAVIDVVDAAPSFKSPLDPNKIPLSIRKAVLEADATAQTRFAADHPDWLAASAEVPSSPPTVPLVASDIGVPSPALLSGDTDAAIAFLARWPTPFIQLLAREIDPETHEAGLPYAKCFDKPEDARAWINERQGRANMYFSVNALRERLDKKAKKENLDHIVGFHLDVDAPEGEDQEFFAERVIEVSESLDLEPSVTAKSGGGVQLFWLLPPDQYIAVDGDPAKAKEGERRTRWLREEFERKTGFKADGVDNADRIMRLPGTINVPDVNKIAKGRHPAPAKLVRFSDLRHDIGAFGLAAPKAANDNVTQVKVNWDQIPPYDPAAVGDLSPKARIIIEHVPRRDHPVKPDELNAALIEARLLEEEYGSWSQVTFGLASVLKGHGWSPEKIASLLLAPLPCNEHVIKQKSTYNKQRAVERAIANSHDPASHDDGRPPMLWREHEFPQLLDAAERIFVERGVGLYQNAGRLVHLYRHDVENVDEHEVRRAAGSLVIGDVGAARLIEYATTNISFTEERVRGRHIVEVPVAAPMKFAVQYLARNDKWRLPVLTGIVETPTLRADGTLIDKEGYDRESGIFFDANGAEFPPIPDAPTPEQAKKGIAELKDVLCDFPCVDDASRAVALSAILTSMARRTMAIAPVHGFDAPAISTGKSMLGDVVSLLATGHPAAVMPLPASEEEATKVWLSILRQGDAVISIDNVDRPVGGATMCSVITQPYFQARLLGESQMVKMPTNVTVLTNGNNLVFAADMASRALKARMDSGLERPDERRFKYDLRVYIPEHRGELVAAGLTALRGFIVAGRPMDGITPSRFHDWDRLVRGCLIWCGEADPQGTREDIESLDPARSDLGTLIEALHNCNFDKPRTAQEIIERAAKTDAAGQALRQALQGTCDKGPRGVTALLKRHVDTIVNGWRIRRDMDSHGKVARWWVQRAGTKDAQGGLL